MDFQQDRDITDVEAPSLMTIRLIVLFIHSTWI
jgi:hypothetical protein